MNAYFRLLFAAAFFHQHHDARNLATKIILKVMRMKIRVSFPIIMLVETCAFVTVMWI